MSNACHARRSACHAARSTCHAGLEGVHAMLEDRKEMERDRQRETYRQMEIARESQRTKKANTVIETVSE